MLACCRTHAVVLPHLLSLHEGKASAQLRRVKKGISCQQAWIPHVQQITCGQRPTRSPALTADSFRLRKIGRALNSFAKAQYFQVLEIAL